MTFSGVMFRDAANCVHWVPLAQIVRVDSWGNFLDGPYARVHLVNGEIIQVGEPLTKFVGRIEREAQP